MAVLSSLSLSLKISAKLQMWLFLNTVFNYSIGKKKCDLEYGSCHVERTTTHSSIGIWKNSIFHCSARVAGSSLVICTFCLAVPNWLEPLPLALSSTWAVSITLSKYLLSYWLRYVPRIWIQIPPLPDSNYRLIFHNYWATDSVSLNPWLQEYWTILHKVEQIQKERFLSPNSPQSTG